MPADVHGFLSALGRRLREARRTRGLGLAETARQAGVSRRHLTEAEAGRANPSVLVLARLAGVLELPVRELVDVPARAGGARAAERVALVGLRGAGKSSVGRFLARRLEVPFVELDRRVEELAGLSLGELFDLQGAEAFHRYEAEALERVLAEGRVVIAAGGSIVDQPETFERLRATCRTIWLRASPEEHMRRVLEQGDRRPMHERPRAMQELRAILRRREPFYGRSEIELRTDGRSPQEIAAEAAARLEGVEQGPA